MQKLKSTKPFKYKTCQRRNDSLKYAVRRTRACSSLDKLCAKQTSVGKNNRGEGHSASTMMCTGSRSDTNHSSSLGTLGIVKTSSSRHLDLTYTERRHGALQILNSESDSNDGDISSSLSSSTCSGSSDSSLESSSDDSSTNNTTTSTSSDEDEDEEIQTTGARRSEAMSWRTDVAKILTAVVEGNSLPSEPPPFCVHPEMLPKAEDIFAGIKTFSSSQNMTKSPDCDDDNDDDVVVKPWRLPPIPGQGPVNLIVAKTKSRPPVWCPREGVQLAKHPKKSDGIVQAKKRGQSCQNQTVKRTTLKPKTCRPYRRI